MRKISVLFVLYIFICSNLNGQEMAGTWNGVLDIPNMKLRIVFHIEQSDSGWITKMDSPDQGAKGIPTDATTVEGDHLTITATALNMTYEGTLDSEKQTIEGTFKQGGMGLPLTLSRKEVKISLPRRPQDPVDFPYNQEEVVFHNSEDDVKLAGTLSLPKNEKPSAVVIIVSGSGPQNRDGEIAQFNHRPYLVLGDYLTRQGIGVLRYDDRGVAGSSGDRSLSTTADFAEDASAAISYLSGRPDLKGIPLGVIGHSEGGMIAPMVANINEAVDFIVLLAAPGIPINELMIIQSQKVSEGQGVPKEMMEANHSVLKEAYAFLKANKSADEDFLKEGLEQVFIKGLETHFSEEARQQIGDLKAFAKKEAAELINPWFVYFIAYEPADHLEKLDLPVLALNGTLDVQVTADENLEGIRNALSKADNKNAKLEALEGLNHLFQKATTGAVSEYSTIDETFNEAAMQTIAGWIKEQ